MMVILKKGSYEVKSKELGMFSVENFLTDDWIRFIKLSLISLLMRVNSLY